MTAEGRLNIYFEKRYSLKVLKMILYNSDVEKIIQAIIILPGKDISFYAVVSWNNFKLKNWDLLRWVFICTIPDGAGNVYWVDAKIIEEFRPRDLNSL